MIFFFFNDTATTEIYTLSLHDALPIFARYLELQLSQSGKDSVFVSAEKLLHPFIRKTTGRSEEHTSELQSLAYLVCRLLLEKKNKTCSTIRLTLLTNTIMLQHGAKAVL